ncbi:NAD-dependent epimerase/dehydratase family protein [Paenibacillus cisolokensis]|uniref:NAD-dependent epimerase/dehydratase family protein n=1 Tax=Paenibacillus cisolokensis TaxID=1658519 RepID=UPI003D2DD553
MATNKLTGKKLLITGAAGFTGRHACEYFAKQGCDVVAVARHVSALEDMPGIKPWGCQLDHQTRVEEMIRDTRPDYVLHLAGKNSASESWHKPASYMESNVMASVYLLEAMRKHRPDAGIVIAGSRLSIDPAKGAAAAPHPYSLSKTFGSWVATAWHAMYGLPVILAEPSNLIGPGESAGFCTLLAGYVAGCEQGKSLPVFRISSRHESRDFLDVRDAVAAYAVLLTEGTSGRTYPISSGSEHTLGEIAAKLLAEAKFDVPMDWGPESAPLSADALNKGRSGDQVGSLDTLGWQQRISFEQSLSDIMEYARRKAGMDDTGRP